MFPYLDLTGVKRRSFLYPAYFDEVEQATPGFTAQSIASHSSTINSRLRKRYGRMLPFGQTPPLLLASGTTPPAVSLTGRPVLGSFLMVLAITTPGALGTAVFQWSSDGGYTYTTGVLSAATVGLGTTGMSALFPAVGTYSIGNAYAAAPPVPETILGWLNILVSADVLRRRGVNPNDPLMLGLADEMKRVRLEIEEAANTQTGLFDLPISEDESSAVDTGGPRSYSEASPYAWTYRQQQAAFRGRWGGWDGGACPANSLVGG